MCMWLNIGIFMTYMYGDDGLATSLFSYKMQNG